MESERAMLAHRATHDTLTAMPNRDAFDEHLGQRIETAETRGGRFALLFIDADNFKAANDNFGHAAGDAVLVALSARIKESLRKGDFAARIGGDEFIVIVELDSEVDPEDWPAGSVPASPNPSCCPGAKPIAPRSASASRPFPTTAATRPRC